ncbi:hypothetical protein GGF46_002087 [Coemansia sp. RSA 552]|nr:hypothetical protein GGF46_002087 [Coemansia sp. RSA 552]
MVKFLGTLAIAASLLSSMAVAAPVQVVPEQARRDYHQVNPQYGAQQPAPNYSSSHYAVPSDQYAGQPPAAQPSYYATPVPTYQSNDWKSQMLQQVNAIRAEVGKPPLRIDERLNNMAQAHSNYQSSASTMTHSDPSGSLGDRCTDYGIDWRGVAENVAWNYKDVTQVVQGWKDSPGHYQNIVGNYNVVGFGVTDLYWTQDFASV